VTTPRYRWTGPLFAVVGVAFTAIFAGPPLYSVANPPAPPAVQCPEEPRQFAGHHFDRAEELIQADFVCADLRDAVFDGVDLTQADLSGADLRGASLRHTSLIQADLSRADLRGADLTRADLTQADLSGADLRGARLWLTGSIQADTGHLRIGVVERGAVQLAYLLVPAALVLLLRPLLRIARRRPAPVRPPGRRSRPRVVRLAILALVAPAAVFILWLMLGGLAALWSVQVRWPFLISEAILVLAIGVEQFAPAAYAERERSI